MQLTAEPDSNPRRHANERASRSEGEELITSLRRIGELLRAQGGNPHRWRAYANASESLGQLSESIRTLYEREGHAGLMALRGVGSRIAALTIEFLGTGRMALLERLRGEVSPEDLFSTVPFVGPVLAHRIHAELGVDTLEALEWAAFEGKLEEISGIGPRRAQQIRSSVAELLSRHASHRLRPGSARQLPPVRLLLEVDEIYRKKAECGELPRIAPRRFNPEGASWLPVLHIEREGWELTALYSNTARAHRLGRTRDWVVLFFEHEGEEGQCTVVTEHRGPLRGQRVVRGREEEALGISESARRTQQTLRKEDPIGKVESLG